MKKQIIYGSLAVLLILALLFVSGCGNKEIVEEEIEEKKCYLENCKLKEELSKPDIPFNYINGTIENYNYLIDKEALIKLSKDSKFPIICSVHCGKSWGYGDYDFCIYRNYEKEGIIKEMEGKQVSCDFKKFKKFYWESRYRIKRQYERILCCVDKYCADMGKRIYESWMECEVIEK